MPDRLQQITSLFEAQRYPEAEALAREAIEERPDDGQSNYLLGVVLAAQDRVEEAIAFLQKAVSIEPKEAPYHLNHARALGRLGRTGEAIRACEHAVQLAPSFTPARSYLASLLERAGRLEDAGVHYRAILQNDPGHAAAHARLGAMLLERGEVEQAIPHLQVVVRHAPDHLPSLMMLARALLAAGRPAEAAGPIERAMHMAPDDPQAQSLRGTQRYQIGDYEQAIQTYERLLERHPSMTEERVTLAHALLATGDMERAAAMYEQVIRELPEHAYAHYGLAFAAERLHDLERARRHAERALQLEPRWALPATVLVQIHLREGESDQALELIDRFLSRSSRLEDRGTLLMLRGQAADAAGQSDEAFTAWQEGNLLLGQVPRAARISRGEAFDQIRERAEQLDAGHHRDWPTVHNDGMERAPVFFVGFPRSGTTLVERMLDAHPEVVALDEQPLFRKVLAERAEAHGGADVGMAPHLLSDSDVRLIRTGFFEEAKRCSDQPIDQKLIVDKMPLRLVALPLIRRVFPESKVLVAIRDPRDVVLSCFSQAFQPNAAMIQFLEIESTCRYYAAVMQLWLRYRSELGLQWMEYRYEDLVCEPEPTLRRIVEFLGLQWDSAMLQFHQRQDHRHSFTPNYVVASQPISTSRSGRWRRYEKHLSGHIEHLSPLVREWGYDAG